MKLLAADQFATRSVRCPPQARGWLGRCCAAISCVCFFLLNCLVSKRRVLSAATDAGIDPVKALNFVDLMTRGDVLADAAGDDDDEDAPLASVVGKEEKKGSSKSKVPASRSSTTLCDSSLPAGYGWFLRQQRRRGRGGGKAVTCSARGLHETGAPAAKA